MYAITSSGFRVVGPDDLLMPGETLVAVVPAALLDTIAATDARAQRDVLLRSCDWTQQGDAALLPDKKAAWVAYRQDLRLVPQQVGFPDVISWPIPPTTTTTETVIKG